MSAGSPVPSSPPSPTEEERGFLLVVEDDPVQQALYLGVLEKSGYRVALTGSTAQAREVLAGDEGPGIDAALLDLVLPEETGMELLDEWQVSHPTLPVIMVTADNTASHAVYALKHGAFDYLTKPVNWEDLLLVVRNAVEKRHMARELAARRAMQDSLPTRYEDGVFAGAAMAPLLAVVEQVKASGVPVMILGPSGSGKEVLARLLHRRSPRAKQPFVAVNCAALPKDLVEDELFGHERGAFTGATARRMGRFEEAGTGTIFLDEVGELEPAVQAKLLRVLQEKELTRVGGSHVAVHARVITATNRDLAQDVKDGRFREDLYYRLEVVSLTLPRLAARLDEIPELAAFLLERFCKAEGLPVRSLAPDAVAALERHSWPGNVRELENVLKRTCLLRPSVVIHAHDLVWSAGADGASGPDESGGRPAMMDYEPRERADEVRPLKEEERGLMLHALALTRGNVSEAARRLGIGRTTFYRRARKHGIPLD